MRAYRKAAAGCALLLALATACCAGQDDGAGDTGAAGATEDRAATTAPSERRPRRSPPTPPYVSATTASATDSGGSPATYNLAFVISSGDDCVPRWNGVQDIDDTSVAARVAKLKESPAPTSGVSFGGASGTELAAACGSAADLAQAHGEALDAAGSTRADFDIEGGALTDTGSVVLRSEAIALLQEERDGLEVSFTLPVMPSGLDADSLTLLASANDHGVQVATVNPHDHELRESYDGDMGQYALTSAEAAHTQFREVFGTLGRGRLAGGMGASPRCSASTTSPVRPPSRTRARVRRGEGASRGSRSGPPSGHAVRRGRVGHRRAHRRSGVEQEDGAFGAAFGAEGPSGEPRGNARSAPPVHQTAAHDGGHARGRAVPHERGPVGNVEHREPGGLPGGECGKQHQRDRREGRGPGQVAGRAATREPSPAHRVQGRSASQLSGDGDRSVRQHALYSSGARWRPRADACAPRRASARSPKIGSVPSRSASRGSGW